MLKVIVDTNIVFSALLKLDSRIGRILLSGSPTLKFFAPNFLKDEILNHQSKVQKLLNITNSEFEELLSLILLNITLMDVALLPEAHKQYGEEICKDIDPNDKEFVSFSKYLDAKLWTGDKKLISGLKAKGFNNFITIEELFLRIYF